MAFMEGRLSSCQSEPFKKLLKARSWLEKSRPSKKSTMFWTCKHTSHSTPFWKKTGVLRFQEPEDLKKRSHF